MYQHLMEPPHKTDLNRKLGLLKPLLGGRTDLSLLSKLDIYKTTFLPTVTYSTEVWGSGKASNIVPIQSLQS